MPETDIKDGFDEMELKFLLEYPSGKNYPANTAVSHSSSPPGTFLQKERQRLSDRNSILMT